jgi:hypothetical protein
VERIVRAAGSTVKVSRWSKQIKVMSSDTCVSIRDCLTSITPRRVFVMNSGSCGSGNGTVGEYNATTGALINANLITGLHYPYELALSGNILFVTNTGSSTDRAALPQWTRRRDRHADADPNSAHSNPYA